MGQAIGSDSREIQLSALNAKAEALSMRDASAWDEAIDWGVPDYGTLCPPEWRSMVAPESD